MSALAAIDAFLLRMRGQALLEGTRYAREARVTVLAASAESCAAMVRGHRDDYEVALWIEGTLQHRCGCPSWRDPCKHEVAAALVWRQSLAAAAAPSPPSSPPEPPRRGDAETAPEHPRSDPRQRALEERLAAARREKLVVERDAPPFLRVASASGFAYRVQLRGGSEGPHGCECPDFEANRLHTCKHVERVRSLLRSGGRALTPAHRAASGRPRVYLHFGEVVEPRLFGKPAGRGARDVLAAFDEAGMGRAPMASDLGELRRNLERFGRWVEPEALAWVDARLARRPRLPAGPFRRLLPQLRGEPYPYQWEGAEFLARTGRALLADEMGLGKTVQAILAAAALRRADGPAAAVTVVCPASLRGGWADEIRRWLGEDATLLEGPTAARAGAIAARPRWLITHYEQVLRDFRHHAANPPDLLVLDEAQRAKGLTARTARVLKAIGARYVFALTGTPLENRLEEAYAIAQLVDQRLLPPLWQIDRDHFVRTEGKRSVHTYRDLGKLRSRLAPAFLRRRKEDVSLQLPERVRSIASLPMHPAVVDTYEELMMQVARIARKKVLLPADLERMQRLLVLARRACNGPHMLGREVEDRAVPKLSELENALRELCLGEGRKAVVFSEWTDMTDRVEALCGRLRLPAAHLHGSVPVKQRPALIRSFTEHEGPAVFISTDAGGVGLNLQTADVVVNLDLPWNPARLEQRIGRVHRIGSKRTVQVLLLVTRESIEERILRLHETKRNVLANIWAQGGEDVIAAPGGSGAFKEMVGALLEQAGPPPETAEQASFEASDLGGPPAGVLAPAPRAAPLRERSEHGQPRGANGGAASPNGGVAGLNIDPAALARAISAVAPSLPPDHRCSLALVFRSLAEALEG